MNILNNSQEKFNLLCQYHQDQEIKYIYLNTQSEDILLCQECISQLKYSNIKTESLLSIESVFKSEQSTIFNQWPPLPNQRMLFEVKEYFKNTEEKVEYFEQIIFDHFTRIQKAVNSHLEILKKNTIKLFRTLPDTQEEFFSVYNKFADKERLKNSFLKNNTNFQLLQLDIKNLIGEKLKEKIKNEETLSKIICRHKQYIAQLDSNKLQQVSQKIINLVSNISYFPDISDQLNYSLHSMNDLTDQVWFSPQLSPSTNFLGELVKNPLMQMSKECQSRFTQVILDITPYLNNLDLKDPLERDKYSNGLQQLNQKQIKLLTRLTKKMVETGDKVNLKDIDEDSFPNTKVITHQIYHTQKDKIFKLTQYLPIFELIQLIHQTMDFQISHFSLSQQNLSIEGNQTFYKRNKNDWNNIIVSKRALYDNETYSITFEAKPATQYYNATSICLGLISEKVSQIQDRNLYLVINRNNRDKPCEVEQVKKGTKNNLNNCSQFKLLVNITKGQFELSDYPQSNNIIELNSDLVKKRIKESFYPFYIAFSIYEYYGDLTIRKIDQTKNK